MAQNEQPAVNEQRGWRKIARTPAFHAGTVALIAGAVFLAFYGLKFDGLLHDQALNQAQLGRSLAEGRGYTTQVITPLDLYFDRTVRGHAEVATPPLGPAVLAFFFRLFGATDGAAALASGVAYVASVLAVWALARRMGGAAVGLYGAALYGLTASAAMLSISGTPAPLAALLVTICFLAALVAIQDGPADDEGKPTAARAWWCVVSGAVLGLAVLTESFLLPLALPIILFVRSGNGARWRKLALWFMIGLIVPTAPWVARNWGRTGRPFFSTRQYELVQGTRTWPGRVIYQDLTWTTDWPVAVVARRPGDLARKAARGLALLRSDVARLSDLVLAGVLVALLLVPSADRTRRALHIMVLGAAVLNVVVGALFTSSPALYVCLLPAAAAVAADRVVALSAASVASVASDRGRVVARALLLGGLALLVVAPTVGALAGRVRQRAPHLALVALRGALPADAIVMTDVPWAVAWYADRIAIEICQTDAQFDTISDDVVRIDALYFYSHPAPVPMAQRGKWWLMAYNAPWKFKGLLRVPAPGLTGVLRVREDALSR